MTAVLASDLVPTVRSERCDIQAVRRTNMADICLNPQSAQMCPAKDFSWETETSVVYRTHVLRLQRWRPAVFLSDRCLFTFRRALPAGVCNLYLPCQPLPPFVAVLEKESPPFDDF